MKKVTLTKKDKEEFLKTEFGKKIYSNFTLFMVILLISCIVAGFLTGYGETGKELFKHQNVVILLAFVLSIISSEQLGRCEGAMMQFNVERNKAKQIQKSSDNKLESVKENEIETIQKPVKESIKNTTKTSVKKSSAKKTTTNTKKTTKRVKNEE